MCGDLTVNKSGNWQPFGPGSGTTTIKELRQAVNQCQSRGCGILLQAVATCWSHADDSDTIITDESQPGQLGLWLRPGNLNIFVTEGKNWLLETQIELTTAR